MMAQKDTCNLIVDSGGLHWTDATPDRRTEYSTARQRMFVIVIS